MISKKILLVLVTAIAITTTTIYANEGVPSSIADLDESFAGFEIFLTDLSNEVNINTNNITELNSQITTLQQQTKFSENGKFNIPGIAANPTQENGINGTITTTYLPLTVDFEFISFQNHIVFTNGTIIDIPGPHLLLSFVTSVEMFFKENLANGTRINHPLCSITAGDSISQCNLIGWNTTVVPQSPTVIYLVDSNAPTNIYSVYDMEGIFSITITQP